MEFEHLCINQSLEDIFEDVATFDGVLEHSASSGCFASSSLILLLLWSNLNRETTCSSLKEYCWLAHACSAELFPLADLGFKWDLTSVAKCPFFLVEKWFWSASCWFVRSQLAVLFFSLDPGDDFLRLLSLKYQRLPSTILGYSYLR